MDYYSVISRKLNGTSDFLGIVEGIIDRIDFDDVVEQAYDIPYHADDYLNEALTDAIDDELIYTDDQWEVLKHYCTPQNANFNDAYMALWDDCYSVASGIFEEMLDEYTEEHDNTDEDEDEEEYTEDNETEE